MDFVTWTFSKVFSLEFTKNFLVNPSQFYNKLILCSGVIQTSPAEGIGEGREKEMLIIWE
jgi:hypothetical protein